MSDFENFLDYVGEINDLLCTINILNWDANSNMPASGAKTRGMQLGTLSKLAQERLTADEFGKLIAKAERAVASESKSSYRFRMVEQTREAYDISRRVPAALLEEHARNRSVAEKVWVQAKANNDFAQFAPYIEKFVALNQEMCAAIGYGDGHPYDAMLRRYEPGMTVTRLKTMFAELKNRLKPLLDQIVTSDVQMPIEILKGDYPADQQRAYCIQLAEKLGYDIGRGQHADSPHPFEISFTSNDVRITNRYKPDILAGGLFGMIHETGHALYEQGIDPQLARTPLATDFLSQYAVGGTSFGAHESQSRLWENQIGRSRQFWKLHFKELQDNFPTQLHEADAEQFYRAINHVEPSLIRVEADEVTYNFHIMLRFEIEMGLLDGSISVNDLPDVWRRKMVEYLGVEPPDDSRGVLQDIHWAFGQMGTFPAYSIGNIMSAQVFQAAHSQLPDLAVNLAEGRYRPLLDWLIENMYRHGRAYSPDELLVKMGGERLNAEPYLDYVEQKYSDLYQLR